MIELRPIQIKTIDRIYDEFKKGSKKVLVMLPTGAGKTIIATYLIENCISKGNRALFTVPRINLINQTTRNFSPENVSVIQGNDDRFDDSKPIQIATIQTLNNREIKDIQLVIFDEIHYAYEGDLIQSIFSKLPNAFFIGLSATPTDENGYLLDNWDSIIDDFQLIDVINEKWLVPIESYSCIDLNLDRVKQRAGDYIPDELEKAINKKPVLDSILENYTRLAHGKKFICFAVNKEHGNDLNEMFNNAGIKTAFVHSTTPINERKKYYSDFEKGTLTGLINIEILTAGYDEPSIECVIMACPTKSWRKYIQAIGRGVRLLGNSFEESERNGKSKCIFLDCGNLLVEHGIPTDRKKLMFKTKISRIIDRELGIDFDNEKRNNTTLTNEKFIFLRKIGSLLDLYDGKIYKEESELQHDVNNFLEKTGWFNYRQNSGKMFKDGRWIHFTSKSGLPDNTLFFNNTPIQIGIELKLKNGVLTDHQKVTLPELIKSGCLLFIALSVFDVWEAIKHIEQNIEITDNEIIVKKSIYELYDKQITYRTKLRLPII